MEFKEAMRIWKRMCKTLGDGCEGCPLERLCSGGLREYPEEAETILTKWQAEHPERTIADDFFEKHPKAMKGMDGAPLSCARKIGYVSICPCAEQDELDCERCWRRPLEEVER